MPLCNADRYARVSTDDQDTAVQVATLKSAGCERIYTLKPTGGGAFAGTGTFGGKVYDFTLKPK